MQRNDIAKSMTIEQLKQQYDLSNKEIHKAVEMQKGQLNKVENELNDYIEVTTSEIENLQDQVDGNITTWFFDGVPTLSNTPADEWTTDEEKNNHLGDLYYDFSTGYAYRFALGTEYEWIKLVDSDVTEALALANSAKDTADSKRRVFVSQPNPPYDNGDLWINNNEVYICQISKESGTFSSNDFINNLKYTDNTKANEVDGKLTVVEGRVLTVEEGVDALEIEVEANKYFEDTQGNRQLISQGMTNVTADVRGLQVTTNQMETSLGENYYTKKNIDQLILNAETGLTNTFKTSGGNNLLRNTAPYFMTSNNTAEFWEGNVTQLQESDSSNGFALGLQNGTLSQSVSLKSAVYTLSFKWKRLIPLSTATIKYNGRTITLPTDKDSGTISITGSITAGSITFEATCDTNNGIEIYELMLNFGNIPIVWTQNANESVSDTVNISKGITVSSNTTNTKAKMDSDGFRVQNKTSGTNTLKATDTGVECGDLTSTGKSNVSHLIIQYMEDLDEIWISGQGSGS